MQFLPSAIDRYSTAFTDKEHPVLYELYRGNPFDADHASNGFGPHARIYTPVICPYGPAQAHFRSRYVYRVFCHCYGVSDARVDGEIHTIEYDDKYKEIIEQYVQKAGVQDKIKPSLFGSGLEVIPQLEGIFDMVFIDADKINYSAYYDLIFDQVPVGGYLIADNVLWSGKVTEDEHQFDKDTRALHAYNEKIARDSKSQAYLTSFARWLNGRSKGCSITLPSS